jgi:signal transduction histidine kinase
MGPQYGASIARRWPAGPGFVRDLWRPLWPWHPSASPTVSWEVRFPLPLGLLLASLGLTAIAAVEAHRVASSQRETADRAMRELASFAAWSYNERLELRLSAMLREALGAVNHGDNVHEMPPVPSAGHLAHYLPFDSRCNCHRTYFGPTPISAFAFELGDRSLELAPNIDGQRHYAWEFDHAGISMPSIPNRPFSRQASSSADTRWVVDTITRITRSTSAPSRGFTLVLHDATERVVAFTLMPTAWGDTMVYGFEYPRDGVAHVLEDVLDDPGLLPATFTGGHDNRDVVMAHVSDARARPLFVSAPGKASPHTARLDMAPQFGRLALNVFVHPERANALVPGSAPAPSRLPILLSVLAVAAALSVVAVIQLRRETAIARMRSDFVANVSHELRTPLTQIKLFTETLRTGRAPTPEQRDWSLSHIDRETTRLASLVDNVLRFENGSRGTTDSRVSVDVAEQTRQIVEEFRPIAASRNVVIETHIEPTPLIDMQPDGVRRILLNYLDNAVKYGPPGQTVRVDVSKRSGEIVIAVADQGPGVRATERERIWEPFTRGSAGAHAAGSGIGLSVVRQIASEHGGRAWVESVNGSGSGARFMVSMGGRDAT